MLNKNIKFINKFFKPQKFFFSANQNNNSNDQDEFISFGYKTVKKEERQGMVNQVFANVASRYLNT